MGMRITLLRKAILPDQILIFDDRHQVVCMAFTAWVQGLDVGVVLSPISQDHEAELRTTFARPYYAVR